MLRLSPPNGERLETTSNSGATKAKDEPTRGKSSENVDIEYIMAEVVSRIIHKE